jgi:hypothetical protein
MSPTRIQTLLFIFPRIRQSRSWPSWHLTMILSKPSSLTAIPSTSLAAGMGILPMSSSLTTFLLPSYLTLLFSFCCLRTFLRLFSFCVCSESVYLICIFCSWSRCLFLSDTFIFTSFEILEKIQLFGRLVLRDKRKLFVYSGASILIKAYADHEFQIQVLKVFLYLFQICGESLVVCFGVLGWV